MGNNKEISRRFFEEVWSEGNLDAIRELAADDIVIHDRDAGDYRGLEEVRGFVQTYREAFPDVRYTVDEQIEDGDKVVTHWTARGSHQGQLMDIPPTGRQATVSGTSIDYISDGRITESTANWDALGLLQQLGVVPDHIARKA